MWSRYCSRARRPAPVSRYSVFGSRPSNDFVQVTYDASSSLRACTLRLPSVVLRSALSSLKLKLSLTASALTMPRRTRSWISRSSSPVRGATPARARATSRSAASAFLAALCLATVPPGNDSAEHDVQGAEPRRHQPVSPRRRSEQRHGAEGHEADAHDGNDADRERAPGHEPGAVQQQPGSGERGPQARAGQRHREQTTDHHRGEKAQAGAASRSREEGIVHGERLTHHGRAADAERHHRLAQPGGEPQLGRRLAGRQQRGDERGRADAHLAPSRHGGERPRPLHRLPDVAEVVEGAIVQRPRSGHDRRITPPRRVVKYFETQSKYASTVRVYISVDMEGIAGVVHEAQTDPSDPACAAAYARFRRLMTAEANAAVEGAVAAGATRVVVNDSHWFMRNLLAEELRQAAELLSGDPKPRSMVQGIGEGFDAALFVGYHARAGTRNAILDHTYADRIYEIRLNGKPVGELGIKAAFAGVCGVPVALVSGDAALAAEAKDLLGEGVGTVVVKEAVSRHAAQSVAPAVACRMIRDEVARALKRKHAPFVLAAPIALEVDFAQTIHADRAELCPGATRTAGRTVAFSHADYREVFRVCRVRLNSSAAA